jgi:hypothetical protein
MSRIRVIVGSAEEACDRTAEFWCAAVDARAAAAAAAQPDDRRGRGPRGVLIAVVVAEPAPLEDGPR